MGSPYFINNVLTGGRLSLKKLWWRQSFMDDTTINVGKVYYANFFDLNAGAENPTTQFLAAQLTNNTAVPFASYGAGAIGQWQFDDQTSIRFGTMNALSSGRSTGFEKLDRGQLFNMAQFEWSPHTSVGDSTLKGNYRAFMWYSGNDEWYDNAGWGGRQLRPTRRRIHRLLPMGLGLDGAARPRCAGRVDSCSTDSWDDRTTASVWDLPSPI